MWTFWAVRLLDCENSELIHFSSPPGNFYDFYLLPLNLAVQWNGTLPISYRNTHRAEQPQVKLWTLHNISRPFQFSLRSKQIYCFVLLLLWSSEIGQKNITISWTSPPPPFFGNRGHSIAHTMQHSATNIVLELTKTGINIPKQHLIFRSYFSHEKQKKKEEYLQKKSECPALHVIGGFFFTLHICFHGDNRGTITPNLFFFTYRGPPLEIKAITIFCAIFSTTIWQWNHYISGNIWVVILQIP